MAIVPGPWQVLTSPKQPVFYTLEDSTVVTRGLRLDPAEEKGLGGGEDLPIATLHL